MLNQTRSRKFSSLTCPASLQRLGLFLTAVACLAFGSFAHAQTASAYRFQDVTNIYSRAGGISNSQVVVGYVFDAPEYSGSDGFSANLITRSFIRNRKNRSEYDTFLGVNASNLIVGYGVGGLSTDQSTAFVLRDSTFTDLHPQGAGGPATASAALGINDQGVIVGSFSDRLGLHGFVLRGGIYTVLDVPGMALTEAYGINNQGIIVVQATDSSGRRNSFVYQNGTYTLLNVPGAKNSYIKAINDLGMIVLNYGENPGVATQSKVYYRGRFTELSYPGRNYTIASGINNAGVITGDADYPFVATPIR